MRDTVGASTPLQSGREHKLRHHDGSAKADRAGEGTGSREAHNPQVSAAEVLARVDPLPLLTRQ
jgi:hypothetical protein